MITLITFGRVKPDPCRPWSFQTDKYRITPGLRRPFDAMTCRYFGWDERTNTNNLLINVFTIIRKQWTRRGRGTVSTATLPGSGGRSGPKYHRSCSWMRISNSVFRTSQGQQRDTKISFLRTKQKRLPEYRTKCRHICQLRVPKKCIIS